MPLRRQTLHFLHILQPGTFVRIAIHTLRICKFHLDISIADLISCYTGISIYILIGFHLFPP